MESRNHAVIRWAFVAGNCALAALMVLLLALVPTRYWAVDVPAGLLALLALWSAIELARVRPRSFWVLRASAVYELAVGLGAISALALGVSYLGGIHGLLAKGALTAWAAGSMVLFPYLVVYPALQLLWLYSRAQS
jgi:hypothetical protein